MATAARARGESSIDDPVTCPFVLHCDVGPQPPWYERYVYGYEGLQRRSTGRRLIHGLDRPIEPRNLAGALDGGDEKLRPRREVCIDGLARDARPAREAS